MSSRPGITGSFQAGVGVGATGVNPLVNTQFQYLDVGVNVESTKPLQVVDFNKRAG